MTSIPLKTDQFCEIQFVQIIDRNSAKLKTERDDVICRKSIKAKFYRGIFLTRPLGTNKASAITNSSDPTRYRNSANESFSNSGLSIDAKGDQSHLTVFSVITSQL
jgi:hypothetical protein